MVSDILPTGFECGVLNGRVKPGDTVAIVGAGPVGIAVLLTAQFYSPAEIFMIDLDDNRLAVAKKLGATTLINSKDGHAAHKVMELVGGAGSMWPSRQSGFQLPLISARLSSGLADGSRT
jgi:alcohol dehydrogenase